MLSLLASIYQDMLSSLNRFSHFSHFHFHHPLLIKIFFPSDNVSVSISPVYHRPSSLRSDPLPYSSETFVTIILLPAAPLLAAPPPIADHQDIVLAEPTPAPRPVFMTKNNHPMKTRSKDGIYKPNPKYGLASILTEVKPETYTQALKDKRWRQDMSDEADAFVCNDTFDLVDRSEAKNIVGSK